MYDLDQFERPEVREVINETLKDVLNTSGWGASHWDVVIKGLKNEFGIEADLLLLAQLAPCLVEMFQIGALTAHEKIGKDKLDLLRGIIHSLVRIALRAEQGEKKAANQLRVIHKLAFPDNYELPATVIETLTDSYHISPHLARAWSIRELMISLSYIVEPTSFDRNVLDGPIRMTKSMPVYKADLHEKAKRHIRRGSTLLSLATSIYIEQLEEEGITLEPRQIKRDLQKLKEWEAVYLKENPPRQLPLWHRAGEYPPASLPAIPIYSDGWKRLWRRGGKNRD